LPIFDSGGDQFSGMKVPDNIFELLRAICAGVLGKDALARSVRDSV
jgi:hypothetical protein